MLSSDLRSPDDNLPMCGRYKLSRRKQVVEDYFDTATSDEPDWAPRFNIAPTQPIPVVRQHPTSNDGLSVL